MVPMRISKVGEIVLELHGNVIGITVKGGKYKTALQAGACGSAEIVRLLLEKGADPNIQGA